MASMGCDSRRVSWGGQNLDTPGAECSLGKVEMAGAGRVLDQHCAPRPAAMGCSFLKMYVIFVCVF